MAGSRWHGFETPPKKVWSVKDCPRNRFQLAYLQGQNVYEWFDRPIESREYRHPLMPHQVEMADAALTYHYQIFAAEMGTGKTLAAQTVIEESNHDFWYWVGPAKTLDNMRHELTAWGFPWSKIRIEFMSYERLTTLMDVWQPGDDVPFGVIFDESSKLKNHTAQRTKAAQFLADRIREKYGLDGFCVLMSGTPAPKTPTDWWSQCEIAWPGFLREGSPKALEERLGIHKQHEFESGVKIKKLVTWKDDERRCNRCGEFRNEGLHELDPEDPYLDFHDFEPSVNEVAYLRERTKGLVVVKLKKDVLELPDKRYRTVKLQPTESMRRTARTLLQTASNTMTGITLLRELSDGFVYRDRESEEKKPCKHCGATGVVTEWRDRNDHSRTFKAKDMLDPATLEVLEPYETKCPNCDGEGKAFVKIREAREVPCPKDDQLVKDLATCEETGRIVIFAGFTGSLDRIANICRREGWAVWRCDGRGNRVTDDMGNLVSQCDAISYWNDTDRNEKVAFVAHPESGGMSLTLTQARMSIFWSNTNKPEYRSQAEDRTHRKGMDENLGCEIVDYVHLNSDQRVIDLLRENRRIELMTLGEFSSGLEL